MRHRHLHLIILLLIAFVILLSPYAEANVGRIFSGLTKIVTAPFYIPVQVARNLGTFPLGPVGGVLMGTFQTVSTLLSGVFDIVAGGAPYAKYALFFV